MRVEFHGVVHNEEQVAERAYFSLSQMNLTLARSYEVHAVSVYNGITFLLVIDDIETPTFLPRSLFDVIDVAIPGDWIANSFCEGPVQLVIGPAFIAESVVAYDSMVDQTLDSVQALWVRVREGSRTG